MTKKNGKQPVFDEAFRREAVRILATGGRTVRQVADDLGIGFSTLNKWKSRLEEAELMAGPHDDVMKELARLRRENELLPAGARGVRGFCGRPNAAFRVLSER